MAEAKYSKVCEVCKTTFIAKLQRKRFCSKSCTDKNRALNKSSGPYSCQCCGAEFYSKRKEYNQFCSMDCKMKALGYKSSEIKAIRRIASNKVTDIYLISVLKEFAALLRIKRKNKRKYGSLGSKIKLKCKLCKEPFVHTVTMGSRPDYCFACKVIANKELKQRLSRIHKAKRRAIERSTFADNIDPIEVFEIAKWKCHICGCKTPKELRGTYKDNAPELDHIVTLAEGGSHAYTNVDCACRKCNQTKGSRSLGQIKLF